MPTRNCNQCRGHVGRGVLRTRQHRDPELEAVLTSQNLVALNSWGSAASSVCHTFHNGQVRSMIDLIALRKPTADARFKRVQRSSTLHHRGRAQSIERSLPASRGAQAGPLACANQ